MKKKLLTIAALICCTMATTVFTACGDDDEGGAPVDDQKPVAVVMAYSFSTTADMLNVFDLTVEYYDATGAVQSEKMTTTQWTKAVTPKLPATVGARLLAKVKDGVDVANMESVTVAYQYEFSGKAVSANGQLAGSAVGGGTGISLAMAGNKVAEYLTKHQAGLVKYLYKYSSDGNAESGSW